MDQDSNGSLKQDEIIDYANRVNLSESDMSAYWKAYGQSTWKKIPKLKNGTWV